MFIQNKILQLIYMLLGNYQIYKKVTKDDINVYGQINNPLEGNNEIYLKVSTSQRVNYDFKNPDYDCYLRKNY